MQAPADPTAAARAASTKLLLIAHPADRSVDEHPEIASLLRTGWTVSTASPRIVEPGRPRLLVTLSRRPAARAA